MLRGSITYPQITREKFCSSATTRAECFSPDKSSAVLLPQLQNVSHQRNILLSCYHKDRMFLTREIFCCPATTKTECFLPEKYSAVLLPQRQNVSYQINILLSCYHKDRIFLTREIFYCSGTTIADFFFCGIGTACVEVSQLAE